MLNELINSRDLAQQLRTDMSKMFDSNLFASVCSREPQIETYTRGLKILSYLSEECQGIQNHKRQKLDVLGSEVKKLISRCKRETNENLRQLSKELVHSERSLRHKQQEIKEVKRVETPFLKFMRVNQHIVEHLDSSLSLLEVAAFLQAKWESMDESEQLKYAGD